MERGLGALSSRQDVDPVILFLGARTSFPSLSNLHHEFLGAIPWRISVSFNGPLESSSLEGALTPAALNPPFSRCYLPRFRSRALKSRTKGMDRQTPKNVSSGGELKP